MLSGETEMMGPLQSSRQGERSEIGGESFHPQKGRIHSAL